MDRAVDRTLLLEHVVSALRGFNFLGRHTFQSERDADTAKHEYAVLDLDVAVRRGGKPIASRSDLTRLQRASKGAE